VVQKFSIARTTYNSLVLRVAQNIDLDRRALLYARDRGQRIRLTYNEFERKKTMDAYKLRDRFLKKAYFQSHILKITDKKTSYSEVRLYSNWRTTRANFADHWWSADQTSGITGPECKHSF
jgi:hypothetical protein